MTGDCMGELLSPPDCAADISGLIAPWINGLISGLVSEKNMGKFPD